AASVAGVPATPSPCHCAIPASIRAYSSSEAVPGTSWAITQAHSAMKISNRNPAAICALPKRSRLKNLPIVKRVIYHDEALFEKPSLAVGLLSLAKSVRVEIFFGHDECPNNAATTEEF